MTTLKGRSIFITGGSRGIGRALALRFAQDGARVAVAAKSDEPHPALPGTIHTVAKEIEAAGGEALPLKLDVRDADAIEAAIEATVQRFGGLDVLVNNASAISPTGLLETPAKRFDLLQSVNTRATFLCGRAAVPHLRRAANPHILTLSPPLSTQPTWYGAYLAYAISKYGMSMCAIGFAEEFKSDGIASNALWPRTMIATDAVRVHYPGEYARCREPAIMADAAYAIVTKTSREFSGHCLIDDEVLAREGVTDLSRYAVDPDADLAPDILIDSPCPPEPRALPIG